MPCHEKYGQVNIHRNETKRISQLFVVFMYHKQRTKTMYFNISVYCNLQGHYHNLSGAYNLLFGLLFVLTGLCISLFSGYVLWKGLVVSDTLRKKQNSFILSLVLSDLLFGILFVPTFVVELSERVFDYGGDFCLVRSWRVLLFSYLFSCRLLSISFISISTYIRTCQSRTRLEAIFTKAIRWLTLIIVWITPAVTLFTLPLARPDSYKTIGTMTYVYYFISISIISSSYILTYSTIRKARSRSDPSYYAEAVNFVRGILIWFLITTFLIATCGLILVILSHGEIHSNHSNDVIEHHVYIAAIFICTLDAIANPIVYMRKFKHLKLKTPKNKRKEISSENNLQTQTNTGYVSYSPQPSPMTNYDKMELS